MHNSQVVRGGRKVMIKKISESVGMVLMIGEALRSLMNLE